ncbi:MAG TPA: hypothetical protein VLN56_04260 [Gammaproteobacteria bacterium]|nr:hypothetical protein [Gammaproteobacteria bacterium]
MKTLSLKHLLSHFILIVIVATTGCGPSGDRYFPLDEGRYWRYDMIYETMDGRFKGIYALEMLETEEKEGREIYIARTIDGELIFYTVDEQGVKRSGSEKTVDRNTTYSGEELYVFRYPLKEGTEWESVTVSKALIKTGPPQKTEFHIRARVPVSVRIESMHDTVRVPAGTFRNCMRVVLSGDSFINAGNYVGRTIVKVKETNWYAPGVGLVKSERNETTTKKALDKGSITLELAEYRH